LPSRERGAILFRLIVSSFVTRPYYSGYRPEIDGLRAVAVLGVVLFHEKIGAFAGGFVGVDIFFVISGYLITQKIVANVRSGTFSLASFYIRRARRILPALLFTVAATFAAGSLWLAPETLKELSKESSHAVLSIANIQYWRESNSYFAQASDQLPLLHCWSLSLEEQFYLVWPGLILLGLRLEKLIVAIVAAAIASFCLAIVWTTRDPQAVFFLMPFRIFEFAIGGSLMFAEPSRRNSSMAILQVTSGLGLLTIIASMVAFDANSPFWAVTLLPCLGAAAVILSGTQTVAARLITNRPALAIGRASYSLYLCHWPIAFFARIIFGDAAVGPEGIAASMAVMVAVAFAMYRFIERRFRYGPDTPMRTSINFAALVAVSVALTHSTFLSGGWAWRLTADQIAQTQLQGFAEAPCIPLDGLRCALGDPGGPLAVEIVGDSFARPYGYALDELLRKNKKRGEIASILGCPMMEDVIFPGPILEKCKNARNDEISRLRQSSSPVIIAQRWERYSNRSLIIEGRRGTDEGRYSLIQLGLERLIQEVGTGSRKFLLVGAQVVMSQCNLDRARSLPAPFRRSEPLQCAPKNLDQARQEGSEINAMLRGVQRKWPTQVSLLVPVDTYCDEECPITLGGVPLYFDASHFTSAGARYFGDRAKPLLEHFLFDGPSQTTEIR
jgi:peptidoglycan/LPS O-acetylase OafA/YrhL